MTLQELIQYIVDRVDTNDNFEVSALDVQEAIVQTATELWNKPADVTPQGLQSVLDEGNEADTSSFINMVLKKLAVSNTIDENGVVILDTTSGTKTISVDLTNGFKFREDYPDGTVVDYKNSGVGDTLNITGTGLGYTATVNEKYTPTGQSYTIETSDLSTRIEKQVKPNLLTYKGNVSDGYYDNQYSLGFFNIEGREILSNSFYQIRYDNSTLSPKGIGGIGLTTDFNNKDFQPLATWDVDGNIRAGVIEEEATDPDFVLVPDSNNVIKKFPSIYKKTYENISLTGSTYVLTERKTTTTVSLGFTGNSQLTFSGNPLTDSYLGVWTIYNEASVYSGDVTFYYPFVNNGAGYTSSVIPENGFLRFEVIKTERTGGSFEYHIIELYKD